MYEIKCTTIYISFFFFHTKLMLQEYPTQIQPRPSSTRESKDALELEETSDKMEAEASRILIDLATQPQAETRKFKRNNNIVYKGNKT